MMILDYDIVVESERLRPSSLRTYGATMRLFSLVGKSQTLLRQLYQEKNF